jgi:NADH-quinone oxidoreductase subunit M
MTIHLTLVVFLPLLAGAIAAFLPSRWAASFATAGAFVTLAYVVVAVFKFDTGAGVQFVTDENWIKELGIHYRLGITNFSLWLVVVTALLWVPITVIAGVREWDRPRLFFFNLMLAETAILGVFCAQDLALFVLFFDLTLVPFYFLIGAWGEGENRVAATTKFVIYTLAGSLLMLAGAVAIGVLATPADAHISFSFVDLAQRPLPTGTQYWIFLLFAAAFLVKAPAFPLHGWMPDTYRATPIPVLIGLSAVLSKLGVYGFVVIVLQFLPQASEHFQTAMMLIAIFSILYGSALAFSQDEARLVVGYSSIAQLGFIVLGIFSLDPKGIDGAIFQMVNHALVVAPLFLLIAVLADRVPERGGRLSAMGGLATRAPLLAALALIATFGTLAMPGSGNFVGELLILFGAFNTKFVYGIVASVGVVLASVYMIRFLQRAFHGREGAGVQSRDILPAGPDLLTIAPLIAVIVALGVCPQIVLSKLDSPKGDKAAKVVAER